MLSSHWQQLDFIAAALNMLPFGALLLAIALFPLLPKTRFWWEDNIHKLWVSLGAASAGIAIYLWPTGDLRHVLHSYGEYLAFMALLGSLFVISGGIHIKGSFAGFPYINTLFLALGAALANVLGTTGASMLLIRPLIRANRHRSHKTHIFVFFIFIVSNCGGLLTPLGDPPLYLGFLRGVPFAWTLSLAKQWAFVVFGLLFVFHLIDERMFIHEDLKAKEDLQAQLEASARKIQIEGWTNVFLLALVIAGVILSPKTGSPLLFQTLFFTALAAFSYFKTSKQIHRDNQFNFHPILEVGALFLGIFGAMLPALAIFQAKAPLLGLTEPFSLFWATGILSGLLDNAPTYLTFVTVAAASQGLDPDNLQALSMQSPHILAAISCGAVFLGALTYVGNGPNFMVKAICEHSRIKMPGFGGYLLWSCAVLIPCLLLMSWIFF